MTLKSFTEIFLYNELENDSQGVNVHSFSKYLLSIYYALGTFYVLGVQQ